MTPKKEKEEGVVGFYDRLLVRIKEGKMTKEILQEIVFAKGLKYSSVSSLLNVILTDSGIKETLGDFLVKEDKPLLSNVIVEGEETDTPKPKII